MPSFDGGKQRMGTMKWLVAVLFTYVMAVPVLSEDLPVETVGKWTIKEDVDPIFGPVSFSAEVASSSDGGASVLSVMCEFAENDPSMFSYGIRLRTSLFTFNTASPRAITSSLFKLDQEDVYEVQWLGLGKSSEVAFASNNIFQENDEEEYYAYLRTAANSKDAADSVFQSLEARYSGMDRFLWNLQIRNTLALGFTVNTNRKSIVFSLAGGRPAFSELFSRCNGKSGQGAGSAPALDNEELQQAARAQASWTFNRIETGLFTRLEGLSDDVCADIHWLKKMKDDPVILSLTRPDSLTQRIESFDELITVEGPIAVLDIQFGIGPNSGEFEYRTYHNQGIDCVGVK